MIDKYKNDLCQCKHKRKYHGKSLSINFTDGKCEKCNCKNFIIKIIDENN